MKRLVLLISAALVSVNPVSAAPRVAVVGVKEVYQGLPSTAALQKEIDEEQEEILRNPRMEALRKLMQELKTLNNSVAEQTNTDEEYAKRNLAMRYEAKRQEVQAMQAEVEQFSAKRTKEINTKLIAAMRISLNRITKTAYTLAEEKGYDIVLDKSGGSSTGVPGLVYFKDASDLTNEVLAILQQDEAPPAPEPAPPSDTTAPSR